MGVLCNILKIFYKFGIVINLKVEKMQLPLSFPC